MNRRNVPQTAMRGDVRLAGAAMVLLVGCGGEKPPADSPQADAARPSVGTPAAPTVLLLCGADTVSVQGADAELQLHVNGETFLVTRSPSASGARYQAAGDSTTFYWNQGARSLVQVRGDLMPECEVVP